MVKNKKEGIAKRGGFRALLFGLFTLIFSACLSDIDLKIGFNMTPEKLSDGWETSTPEAEGMDSGKLAEAYNLLFDEDEYHTAYSMLVIKNGKLVAEGYCRDMEDRNRLNNIKSATKSVTSLIIGIAIAEGLIGSLDDTVYSYLSEFFTDDNKWRRSITLYDTITMRTGIKYVNSENNEELVATELPASSLRYVLEQPMEYEPGTRFKYHDGAPQLLSGIIEKTAGMTLEEYGQKKLLAPLGIDNFFWDAYEKDGVTFGAHGLYLTPRDFAKIGLLTLQNGVWEGRQIVPASWIEESARTHVYSSHGGHGYYWWVRDAYDAFSANGHGGQYAYIVPNKNLLIVFTANPLTNEPATSIGFEYFEDLVHLIADSAG